MLLGAGISRPVTMFCNILVKFPPEQFRVVKQLANRLIGRLDIAPSKRLGRLESLLLELGDWKPSQLYGQLEIFYPDEADSVLCQEWLENHSRVLAHIIASSIENPIAFHSRILSSAEKRAMQTPVDISPRTARWSILLSAYGCDLVYQPGKEISNADALSRIPQAIDLLTICNRSNFSC
ncbi:hypothetical protein TTRE_0000852101 [Trichuris trichiura]|uniref:Uncharacterized protein n=1 Tax=Trichuris trichiura TaxID=36087 RepID=A0A077ZKH2_TRITR|nr:hypothetical protein TTRE_0000852101 [Trichuris trichiura]